MTFINIIVVVVKVEHLILIKKIEALDDTYRRNVSHELMVFILSL